LRAPPAHRHQLRHRTPVPFDHDRLAILDRSSSFESWVLAPWTLTFMNPTLVQGSD
jgi:hypothetical protein